MSDSLPTLAAEVRALLAFQGSLGLAGLDVAPGLLRPRAAAEPQALTLEPTPAPAAASPRRTLELPGEPARPTPAARPSRVTQPTLAPALQAIRDDIGDCKRCKLCSGRTNIVFGVGDPKARLMFVGEGPGRDEDLQGEPFVGAAGQLLDKMIKAMGLARRDVYIANIVKCRPPRNRDPEPDEIEQCEPFLKAQIAAIKPEVIVALGRIAAQTLLRDPTPVSRLRGKWREYAGTPLLPTFHPAYLLRTPSDKKLAWDDLKLVMGRLGLQVPK